jgi:1-acyl-sn-glycerol-3-phosphate acyltransferase
MTTFADTYKKYDDVTVERNEFGFDKKRVSQAAPILGFLYERWFRVTMLGLDSLPEKGPALIVGNNGGILPLPALMLLYALMRAEKPRRLNVLCEMSWIEDERLYSLLTELGFVPWSSTNAKKLFAAGEVVALFPEGIPGAVKPNAEKYRPLPFDWTRLLPAIEEKVPVVPMATLGCDDAIPVIKNLDWLAALMDMPAFPITPLFPWLPFPFSLTPLPVKWDMHLLKPYICEPEGDSRDHMEDAAADRSRWLEGEIQAELNRMIRSRIRAL